MKTVRTLFFWLSPLINIGIFLFIGFPYLFGYPLFQPQSANIATVCGVLIAINAHCFSIRVAQLVAYWKATQETD